MEKASLIISIVSLVVAVLAIIVSIVIYKKQRKYEEACALERKQEKCQEIKNRKEARRMANASLLARLAGVTKELEEDIYLNKQLGKR